MAGDPFGAESTIRVLLLEDNSQTIAQVQGILSQDRECELHIDPSLEGVCERVAKLKPRLLLFSHRIPGKKSLKIFEEILQNHPSLFSLVFLPENGEIWEKSYCAKGAQKCLFQNETFPQVATVAIHKSLLNILEDASFSSDQDEDDDLSSMLFAFQPGDTISNYRILETVAEGGMGEVYKAEDTNLRRIVAIKVLPLQFSKDPRARRRMLREARSASALKHPNIVTIYSIEEANGYYFIVMEYIEGQILSNFFGENRNLRQIAEIGLQVAQALSAAHEMDILHRDIKPANIIVTSNGHAKLLDFGLAKKVPSESSGEGDSAFISRLTTEGSILGTASYMSPEQSLGHFLSARSDLFSLGTVLYEACTGKLPFTGSNFMEVLNHISSQEVVPPHTLVPDIPKDLETIILKLLEKEPERRYASAKELVEELQAFLHGEQIHAKQTTWRFRLLKRIRRNPQITALVTMSVILLFLLVWTLTGFLNARKLQENGADTFVTRLTSGAGLEDEPALSPDGTRMAYTSDERGNLDIAVAPLQPGASPEWITDDESDDSQPAWSADGKNLAFVSARDQGKSLSILVGLGVGQFVYAHGGDLYRVSASGGKARHLIRSAYYPCWSPDGKWIVYQSDSGGEWDLWKIPSEGGTPVRLTHDADIDYHPAWSPDGRWIVYASGINPQSNLRILKADGGDPVQIQMKTTSGYVLRPRWSSDGKFIFFSRKIASANIWKIPFHEGASEATPVRITTAENDHGSLDVVGNKLVYSATDIGSDIWELQWPSGEMRQITVETTTEEFPHLSPDGDTLIFHTDRSGKFTLWSFSISRRQMIQQLSPLDSVASSARWSPDGNQILYQLESGERGGKVVVQPFPTGKYRVIVPNGENAAWSPDGQSLALTRINHNDGDLWIYSAQNLHGRQITSGISDDSGPSFSPDGKRIVFQRTLGHSSRKLFLVSTSGGPVEELIQSDSEQSHPDWSAKLNLILFLRDHKDIFLLNPTTKELLQATHLDKSNILLDFPSWSQDGTRIYFSVHKKIGDIFLLQNR